MSATLARGSRAAEFIANEPIEQIAAKTIETSVKAVEVVCWNGVALAAVYTSPRTAASTRTTASAEPARSCTVGMSDFDFDEPPLIFERTARKAHTHRQKVT